MMRDFSLRRFGAYSRTLFAGSLLCIVAACQKDSNSKKKVSAFLTGYSQYDRVPSSLPTPVGLGVATTQQLFDLRKGIVDLSQTTVVLGASTTATLLRREWNILYSGTLPVREVATRANDLNTSLELAKAQVRTCLRDECERRLRSAEDTIAQLIVADFPTRAPDELKAVQERLEKILAEYYEMQYIAVLRDLESLTRDTQKLLMKYK
jgi:hypothetical protein